MSKADELSDQTRLLISSIIIASFIAALQTSNTTFPSLSVAAYNIGITLLGVSAAFSFVYLLTIGINKKHNYYKKLPFLFLMDARDNEGLHTQLRERAFDWSINIYFFVPIYLLLTWFVSDASFLSLTPGESKDAPTMLYLFSVVLAIIFWNLIGNILRAFLVFVDYIEDHYALRFIFSTIVLVLFSQIMLVAQKDYSLKDVTLWPLLLVVSISIIVVLLEYYDSKSKK